MQLIACFISRDLRRPISLIAFCSRAADAAAMTMPVAAVHEYDLITGRENKVGFAGQVLAVQPETEPELVRGTSDDYFRLRMSGADA